MRPHFLLFLLLGSILSGVMVVPVARAESRAVLIGPPPAWVQPIALPNTATAHGASVGRDYLLIETQSNVAEQATYRHNAYRILDKGGLQHGAQIELSFDPSYQSLTIHRLQLIRGDQVIDRLDRAKIQVLQRESDSDYLLYNGELSALVILDDVRIGDIVEIAHTKRGANPVFGEHYIDALTLDYGMPVARLRHRVIHSRDHEIVHRTFGESKVRLQERDSEAGHELIWEGHDMPAVTYENKVPDWHVTYAFVQLTDFPSWRAVVEWALPLYAEDNPPPLALREMAAALSTDAGSTGEDRALLALRFVQEEIRYLGMEQGPGSHQPSPPEDVLARRFGDCKDKARLLVSLLRQMGFKAAPVLVHSSRRHTLDAWLPSPFAFNHVIAYVEVNGAGYLLDPTLSYQRGGLRQRHTARYRAGLIIDPISSQITAWPPSPNDVEKKHVDEEFVVTGLESGATLHVRSTYWAQAAERMRAYLADTNRDDLTKRYVNFYARYFPGIATAKPVIWSDDEEANKIVVDEDYTIQHVFTRQPDSKVFKAEFYPSALNEYTASPGAIGRKTPYAMTHPVDATARTHLILHEPWSIKSESLEIKDPSFVFSRTTKGSGREIEWIYRWRSESDHVVPDRFEMHSRNLSQVNDRLGYTLTYNTDVTDQDTFDYNWAMVALVGATVAAGSFGAFRLWRIRQPEMPPPLPEALLLDRNLNGLGGWLVLVGFGVVVRPFVLLVTVTSSWRANFNLETWRLLTSSDSASYQSCYAIIAPTELVMNFLLLIASVLLVGLFFARRKLFPRVMIAFLTFALITALFDLWATHALTNLTDQDKSQALTNLFRTLVGSAIWIPYFCVSRRVNLTFTR